MLICPAKLEFQQSLIDTAKTPHIKIHIVNQPQRVIFGLGSPRLRIACKPVKAVSQIIISNIVQTDQQLVGGRGIVGE